MRKRNRIHPALMIVSGAFAIYATITLVSLQLQINEKTSMIAEQKEAISRQKILNAELQERVDQAHSDAFYADIARNELGYAQKGERVWRDISGM